MSIGEKIKYYRKKKSFTQVALAEKANISRSYLGDLEGNRYNPSLDTLKAIALALDLDISELLETDKSNEPASNIDPELLDFWNKTKERESLQLLFRQTKDMDDKDLNTILKIIKAIEDEEDKQYNN